MAIITNRATLIYNGTSTVSNTVTGELSESLTVTKTAPDTTYTAGQPITYVVGLVNASASPLTGITVADDLGAYPFGGSTLVPLDYVDGSVGYFVNGLPAATPTVTLGTGVTFGGMTLPAGGSGILVYSAIPNEYAPLAAGSTVTNTATVTATGLASPVTATETVTVTEGVSLAVTKEMDPTTLAPGDTVTYTITAENYGTTAVAAGDGAVITDLLVPALTGLTVTLNGTLLTENVDYTYDAATGAFTTLAGALAIPAATVTQDPVTGIVTVTPGTAVLVLSGTL